MDLSPNKTWIPKEWESHANNLLRARYRISEFDYIPIPDHDGGDGGIEGFSLDGYVYQMYCPEDAFTADSLYQKQRTKMTDDIGKFISNSKKMKSYFGDLKIKRWVLVVPTHKTRRIISHATKKTNEVKAANLDYVDNENFRVLIWDRNDFQQEETELLTSGLATLKLNPISVTESEVEFYQESEPDFTKNITRKLGKLSGNTQAINKGKEKLIKNAIISQNMLSDLKQDYGDYYQQIISARVERSEQLYIEALDSDPDQQKLSYQISILEGKLKEACKLHTDNLRTISQGTVADWLMNCTLDFE